MNINLYVQQDALDKAEEEVEEEEDASVNATNLIHRRVLKIFPGHGDFNGIITSVESADDGTNKNQVYITYEDGDKEDLDESEISEILLPLLPQKQEAALVRKLLHKIKSIDSTVSL